MSGRWRQIDAACTLFSLQFHQVRPYPSSSVDQLLRRRTQHQHSHPPLRRHMAHAVRLASSSAGPSPANGDDSFVPFDYATSQLVSERPQVTTLPRAFTSPTPPLHHSHESTNIASSRGRTSERSGGPHEPAIELTSDAEPLQHVAVSRPSSEDYDRRHRSRPMESNSRTHIRNLIPRLASAPLKRREGSGHNDRQAARTQQPFKADVDREPWQIQKSALRDKFHDSAWNPRKKISPDAMEGIRALHSQYPEQFTTPILAEHFRISPEAIRRILKGKWRPNADEEEERRLRWDKRGEKIWGDLVDMGVHPPKRWRTMGIGTGPRRPAQDRSLRGTGGNGMQAGSSTKQDVNEGSAWMRSLAGRMN